MRWSKKNKDLIKQVIDRYHWMLEKKSRTRKFFVDFYGCPFCNNYFSAFICDDFCPDVIITDMLASFFKWDDFRTYKCVANAIYCGLKRYNYIIVKSKSNIEKRLHFWEDALALKKVEFVRKYKKC